jgi:mevalonate kinase
MVKRFPAKVLLFGEYTILNGSKALALPFADYSGQWTRENNGSAERLISTRELKAFLAHDCAAYIDQQRLREDLELGLWFDSSIPHGYGLGSSGALIAAIYHSYGKMAGDPKQDRTALARLEDYFHGSSSGIDPYVSFVQKPLLIHSFDHVEELKQAIDLKGFFILNTGKPRQTGPLVSIYQEKLKDAEFKKGCADVLARDVNSAVNALVSSERSSLFLHLWHISKFQWDFFPEMIPTQMRGIWTKGLEEGEYVLKLCGAGGGGFLLGYSEKYSFEQMQQLLAAHELKELR